MKKVAGYRLLAELARGGMGILHVGEREADRKLVVMKELRPELAKSAVHRDMFLDEARVSAELQHPNIVETHELVCEGGRFFLVMELLGGASLHHVREKLGLRALPVRFAVRILVTILDALHHAHERGVIHRDVSAQNVFLCWDGRTKLIDFGVAKASGARRSTQVGMVKGSVPFLSPDHTEPSTIDRRADVFSTGVLLRELLTGERYWGDADDRTILRRLLARDLPPWPISEGAMATPPGLRRIVERALAPNRDDRFATAAEMRDALRGFLAATDPRGSLADLGTWMSRALATERAQLDGFLASARARKGPPPLPATRWLPSSALETRVVIPPPLPARPRARRRMTAGMAFVAAILVGLGLGAFFGSEAVGARRAHAAPSASAVAE